MRSSLFVILFLCLFLLLACAQKPVVEKVWHPKANDGILTFRMNHLGMEEIFFGKWAAPELGREQKFFRYALKPGSGIHFTATKQESFFVEVQLYEVPPSLEVRVNELVLPLSDRNFRKLIPAENIREGENRISFSFMETDKVGIQQIDVYPKRFENLKTHFDRTRDFLTPVKFHFYGNPREHTELKLAFLFPGSDPITGKVFIESENNKKEYTLSISNRGSVKIAMLDESLHHVEVEIPEISSRFIRLEESRWIEPDLKHPHWDKLKQAAEKKNILLILLDAARADHMGYSGYSRDTTPKIDALAKKSFIFSNTFSEAAYTLASTGTLLTGLPPDFHGVVSAFFSRMREDIFTLPELLQRRGYLTAAVSANPFFGGAYNFNSGFDYFVQLSDEESVVGAEEFLVPFANLISNPGDKPFFIYLHLMEPHHPYLMPKPFFGKFQQRYQAPTEAYKTESTQIYSGKRTGPADFKFIRDIYDENLAYADSVVGKILEELRTRGLDESTIVIITSDHGEALGEHNLVGHNVVLHREGIHIPMLFYLPGIRFEPLRIEKPAITSDLVITLCDLLDIKYPYPDLTQGTNLFSLPQKRTRICRSMNLSDRYLGYMVESFPYRAIFFPKMSGLDVQIFNIDSDPGAHQVLSSNELVQDVLGNTFSSFVKRAAKGFRASGRPDLSEKDRESLRALGYIK
jgi:arylsulfatase A-like enzyme